MELEASKQADQDTPGSRPTKKKPASEVTEDGGPEVGGPGGPEPTRYGDWERNGIAKDF